MALSDKFRNSAVDYLFITGGVVLYTLAWASFMIPNGIASGGLTGLSTIIQLATGGLIPVPASYLVINVLLLIAATFVLGKGFGMRTIYAILLSTLLFEFIPKVDFLLAVPGQPLYISERILIPIIGGLLEAAGIAMIFQHGGSTGGSDIAVLMINKFYPVSPGKVFLYSDLVIIASILLLPDKTFQDMVYGYIAMITFSFMVDYVLLGSKSTVQILVFSEKYSQIADYIINDMDRGVTALYAQGWYTKTDRKVLLVLVRKFQLHDVTKEIKKIDPRAFVSVSPASNVYGEGFDEIKTGIERKKKQQYDQQER